MSLEFNINQSFKTNLHSFPEVASFLKGNVSKTEKKEARREISIANTSENLGFMHAVLIEIDKKNYLLAGPSGIGKTTYSEKFKQDHRVSIVARDWVAVEKETTNFYASDLNLSGSLQKRERSLISGIIFLTKEDRYKRDAYVPNQNELKQLLEETFDTVTGPDLQKLSSFWYINQFELPFLCAVTARGASEGRISGTLSNLLKRQQSLNNTEVGIVGLGAIGAELASQLGGLPPIDKIHLYSKSVDKAVGYAVDMNQALNGGKHDLYVAHSRLEDLFVSCSSIFLAFRNEIGGQFIANLPERWQKLPGNQDIVNRLAQEINLSGFDGTFFVITNPVDVLTYSLYQASRNLRTYQVYGIGLEVDMARALYYGREISPNLEYKDLLLFGNHSDELVLKTPLSSRETAQIFNKMNEASKEIRKFIPRTVYGPVGAIIRTYRAFLENGQAHATVLQESSYIGRKIYFRDNLPMLPENIEDPDYRKIIDNNKFLISKFL